MATFVRRCLARAGAARARRTRAPPTLIQTSVHAHLVLGKRCGFDRDCVRSYTPAGVLLGVPPTWGDGASARASGHTYVIRKEEGRLAGDEEARAAGVPGRRETTRRDAAGLKRVCGVHVQGVVRVAARRRSLAAAPPRAGGRRLDTVFAASRA
ncbi:hypothetical protein FB451DRAFT_1291625 [Mycena latifolia]|nr:hypothetical protein FB451DRAFT_1291625 [Mycena latifolia]